MERMNAQLKFKPKVKIKKKLLILNSDPDKKVSGAFTTGFNL